MRAGSSSSVPDTDPRIIATTLERIGLGISIEIVGICLGVALSELVGIPLPRGIVVVNIFVLLTAIAIAVATRRNAIAPRHVHTVALIAWALAPFTTLTSLLWVGQDNLVFMLMIELALAGIMQTSPRYLVASTATVSIAYGLIALRHITPDTGLHIASIAGLTVATWFVGRGIRRSLDSAIHREDLQRETAAALGRELEERHRAEHDRRLAEEDREKLRDQFVHAQRMEAVGTLAAGLAHDMNNIIGGILGLAEVAVGESQDASVRDDLEAIAREAQRAAELTRGLLAFSRRGQYRRAPIELETVMREVEPLLSRMFGSHVTLERRGGADVVIDADAAQLGQAIVNLCINGADAMDGAGVLTLTTSVTNREADDTAEAGAYATISVRDTGRGMDETTQKRIFEPFFTTKPVGQGTGLGLAMVYGTIRGHGGVVEVTSAPNQGSEFTIFLPASARPVEVPTNLARDSGRVRLPTRLALVVDDEPVVRAVVTRILRQMGLLVVGASDGAEALAVFEARRAEISIVVLDMSMPVMGGAECLRHIRRHSRVPVVIASGFANETETRSLIAQGNTAFLEKPFTVDEMRGQVQRLLALPA